MTDRDYKRKLNAMLDEIFDASGAMTLIEMAAAAGLSISTLSRLNNRETQLPRLHTVMCLALAVGLDVELVKHRLSRRAG